MNKAHIVDTSTRWLTKMFTSTEHLFSIDTTWQYMLFAILIFLASLFIIHIIFRLFKYEFRVLRALIKLLSYITYSILSIGLLYYLMVLFKKMWTLA